MIDISDLERIAGVEYSDIVKDIIRSEYKLRLILINRGFVDVNLSRRIPGRFGFHWECLGPQGSFFRYDNFPDKKCRSLPTFPCHFHNGVQGVIEPSPFPRDIVEGFRAFLEFIRQRISDSMKKPDRETGEEKKSV